MKSVRVLVAARTSKVVALIVTACLVGCGGEPHQLSGYQRDPAPQVAGLSLPDLIDGGTEFPFKAEPGQLLLVYFGYTNCPDFCPTTMSDIKLARQRLDDPDTVDVAMVTVDPQRDLPVLADYVTSFVPEAHALGTDDFSVLDQVAAPFGVSYEVRQTDDGTIEVAHSTALYAVDDSGELVLTWPFGVSIDDLAADIEQLREEHSE